MSQTIQSISFDRTCRNDLKPNGYLEFMQLLRSSKFVVTDSGGIQEETTVLGIPRLTVRPNTECPITISEGTNKLVTIDQIQGV